MSSQNGAVGWSEIMSYSARVMSLLTTVTLSFALIAGCPSSAPPNSDGTGGNGGGNGGNDNNGGNGDDGEPIWVQTAELIAPGAAEGDKFGHSVDVDGDT